MRQRLSTLDIGPAAGLLTAALLAAPTTAQTVLDDWHGSYAGDHSGECVVRVGDVDGDGVADLAIGAPDADRYLGFPTPTLLSDVGSVTLRSGATGDVIRKLYGSSLGGTGFGARIVDATDVNWDGHAEILVAAPAGDGFVAGSGVVTLFDGATGQALHTLRGLQTGERLGEAMCVGDLDGNPSGLEVAIGAPDHDLDDDLGGPGQEGRVMIFRLVDGGLIDVIDGSSMSLSISIHVQRQGWGRALAYMGDTDGDGYGRLMVGAPESDVNADEPPWNRTDGGMLLLFEPFASNPETSYYIGPEGHARLGAMIEPVGGDLDGDGHDDVMVSVPGDYDLWLMSRPGDVVHDVWYLWHGPDVTSLAGAGDLDGDGVVDVVTGRPETTFAPGHADVYSGALGQRAKVITGPTPGAAFGTGVTGIDRDGDGVAELVVSAPHDGSVLSGAGSVTTFTDVVCATGSTEGHYGTGLAGTLGWVPPLIASASPDIGTTIDLAFGNALGLPTIAYGLVGFAPTSLPVKGGTLLVDAVQIAAFPLPANGLTLPLVIPDDQTLCGLAVYLQLIHADPGLPQGAAFSQGLELVFGH